jgi:hypothetical protein
MSFFIARMTMVFFVILKPRSQAIRKLHWHMVHWMGAINNLNESSRQDDSFHSKFERRGVT